MDFRNGFVRLCYNQGYVSGQGVYVVALKCFILVQSQGMRDNYIKDVKGGKLKQFSAFLADREWNAAAGVSICVYVCVCVVCACCTSNLI